MSFPIMIDAYLARWFSLEPALRQLSLLSKYVVIFCFQGKIVCAEVTHNVLTQVSVRRPKS